MTDATAQDPTFMDAMREVMTYRNSIREEFIRTWMAFNVTDEELADPETVKRLCLIESQHGNNLVFSMEFKQPNATIVDGSVHD